MTRKQPVKVPDETTEPRVPVKSRWRHRATSVLLTIGLALACVFGSASSAQATPHGKYERIINVWESDGSNYNFNLKYYISSTPNVLTFKTMTPGSSFVGYGHSFVLSAGMCAVVSYNDGPWYRRGPGTHYFADGAKVEVDPHRC